jgi:GntR family transcriptional regulator
VAAPSESRRVADELRRAILAGELADGEHLPTLMTLAQRFAVSRDVARRAVEVLHAERLVVTHRGSGTYVSRAPLIIRSAPGSLARSVWGAGRDVEEHDTEPRPRVVDVVVEEILAPEDVAAVLDVRAGTWVFLRSRRFVVDDRPVQLATSYLPLDIVRGTPATYPDTGPGGLYARLAELGHPPVRFTERITARAPYPDERTRLDLPTTASLVFANSRTAYDARDRCLELSRMVLDAAAYELEYHFDA